LAISLDGEFEHCDHSVSHELRRYGPAGKARVFLFAAGDVLTGLSDGQLVRAAFGLNGNYELPAVLVYADVNLVDFDLAKTFYRGAHVVLE
jgi:hypothetical protein